MRFYEYEEAFEEYELYGSGGYQKNYKSGPSSQKKEYKGKEKHQLKPKQKVWEEIEQPTFSKKNNFDSKPNYNKKQNNILDEKNIKTKNDDFSQNQNKTHGGTFTPGPNTHTIKNNIIDYDRVANIEKVESEYNNRTTYGIKFIFTGKKGSFRIAWFNKNVKERDSVYDTEVAFWQSLKK